MKKISAAQYWGEWRVKRREELIKAAIAIKAANPRESERLLKAAAKLTRKSNNASPSSLMKRMVRKARRDQSAVSKSSAV